MSSRQSWELTPREFDALNRVRNDYLKLWAIERAEFRNAHHLFGEEGVGWTPDDVLGIGDRAARAKEKIQRDGAFMAMQAGLAKLKQGVRAEDVPDDILPSWAKRQWDPADYPDLFGGKAVN